ncbi:MAG TPA: hypothetical protein VMB25_14535 [Bryobacteraceae bacterium]|nr:hypothetical protein [Bryobacteraceae bacterium]
MLRATCAVLGVLLVPVLGNAQSDAGLWRYVHPNAKAVISIDWERVRHSAVGAMLREKFQKATATATAAASMPIPQFPGMELLDDVDRILISTPGEPALKPAQDANPDAPADGAAPAAGPVPDAPLLIVIQGHFDLIRVKQVLAHYGTKPQLFNSTEVYRPQSKDGKDMAIVPLDPQTILIGDAASVFATLERNKFAAPTPAPGSLLARAAEMDANYEAWILTAAPDSLGSDQLKAMLNGSDWGSDARGFEAGVSFRSGVLIDVVVRFASEVSAQKMVTQLGHMIQLTSKARGSEQVMQDLASKLKLTAEGQAAHLHLRLTAQEVAQGVQQMQASYERGLAAGRHAIIPQQTSAQRTPADIRPVVQPAAVPPKREVIRIEGLDSGTREIPYHEP